MYYAFFSIFRWKRLVIPIQPDHISDVDTTGPFFTLGDGENMTKVDIYIDGGVNRRPFGFRSNKLMKSGTEMAKDGVMDATFKVEF